MWSSIKALLKDNTTKCVIVEDGEPAYVVLSFEEYQQLQRRGNSGIVGENSKKADSPRWSLGEAGEDKINGEIQEMADEEEDEFAPATVRLEDLPF